MRTSLEEREGRMERERERRMQRGREGRMERGREGWAAGKMERKKEVEWKKERIIFLVIQLNGEGQREEEPWNLGAGVSEAQVQARSEERRVGKECRSRWF